MINKTTRFLTYFISSTLLSSLLSTQLFASVDNRPNPPDPSEIVLFTVLQKYGREVKHTSDFYMAGHDCYLKNLDKIAYLFNPDGVIFFYNDALGNCILGEFSAATSNTGEHLGSMCTITNSFYQSIYNQENQLAAVQYEKSNNANPRFDKMIDEINKCFVLTSRIKILESLKSSMQLKTR